MQLNEDNSSFDDELEQSTSGSNLFHNDLEMCVSTNKECVVTANSDSQESNLSLLECISSSEEELNKSDHYDQALLLNLSSDPSKHEKVDEHSFTPQLAMWALEHNVPHNAVNDLLGLLQPHFSELPKDARTLLKTPRKVFPTVIAPGMYYHIGFKNCLEKLMNFSTNNILQSDSTLEVCINIDGLPISKSSGGQLYPILCSLFTNKNNVETIGIYHGAAEKAYQNNTKKEIEDCIMKWLRRASERK